jgi:hypothetical protein
VPDFMHGNLSLYISLCGEIYFDSHLLGEMSVNP